MCLAVYHPMKVSGVNEELRYMTYEEFNQAAQVNSDGIGFMFARHGRIRHGKFFGDGATKRAWAAYSGIIRQNVPLAVHFRWATHGEKNKQNVHPFFVREDLAIMHNGILSISGETGESDTAAFARVLGYQKQDPMDDPLWTLMDVLAYADSSKIIFMRGSGEVKIAGAKLGHWRDGSWYSNDGYKPKSYTFGGTGSAYGLAHVDWEKKWEKDFAEKYEKGESASFPDGGSGGTSIPAAETELAQRMMMGGEVVVPDVTAVEDEVGLCTGEQTCVCDKCLAEEFCDVCTTDYCQCGEGPVAEAVSTKTTTSEKKPILLPNLAPNGNPCGIWWRESPWCFDCAPKSMEGIYFYPGVGVSVCAGCGVGVV